MFYKSKFKDYVGILFYRHGLFCASNPVSCLLLVFTVVFICCSPLRNISSLSSSLEQFKQSVSNFDGLEANAEINQFIQYDRLADRPAWYNRVPIAYIQRIVVKSILNIPKHINKLNTTDQNVYLVDAFRTPLAQLFELNEYLRQFRTTSSNDSKSLIDDLCVHVGELRKKRLKNNNHDTNDRHYLPEFNCLYLSPANFWSNDFNLFIQDDDIIHTINNSPSYFKSVEGVAQPSTQSKKTLLNKLSSLLNRMIYSTNTILDEEITTDLNELLFGVSWSSVMTTLKNNFKLNKKLNLNNKSIVFSYAITIALKKFDHEFIQELTQKLKEKFDLSVELAFEDDLFFKNTIFNLQYTSQSVVYYIPYLVLYFLLFMYIYISVRKIEFVKSKWGLAFAAVSQVMASLLMSIGICSYFGLTPTLNSGEIFPYLFIFIGFENIVVLTKSVVSTPFDLDVRYRIALGLKKESWLITKILLFELIIIFFGILTMVPAIQEFCVFAYVGLIIDFFMQMIFFVTVLSIDIRRMELADLDKQHKLNNGKSKKPYEMMQKRDNNNVKCKNEKRNSFSKKYSNLLVNKSVQFFYFWAKTRLVQRCVMALSVVWIVLIFYKSLLVVELMRHDVNVSKETVDALLPKGSGLPKLIQDNFQQYIFTSSKSPTTTSTSSFLSTVDFMKRNFKNLVSISKTEVNNLISDDAAPLLKSNKATTSSSSTNWQSLDYYHWLSLFANYNVSLYNRYVAILPEINLNRILNQNDILKYRNANEIKKYNSILVDTQTKRNFTTSDSKDDMTPKSDDDVSVRWALYELLGIVILGIPTIYFIVYLLTLFYKCLCSKNYEQWRKSWSTANIKRQYKKIHSRSNLRSCMMCDNSSVNKTECSTCRNESDFDSRSSTDSDYESEKMKSNRKSLSDLSDPELSSSVSSSRKVIDHDDLLNRIINGQKDDIELRPLKMFNSNGDKHKYPVDLVSSGVFKVATSDLSNQIKIWSVNTNETSINLDLSETSASVWSLLLTKDDKFVFIGQSSGCLRVFNLETRSFQFYESSASNGITHLVELKPKWPLKSNSILVKNNSDLQLASNYLVLVARLNGLIEILNWTQSEVTLIYSDQVYNSPITNLVSNGGDHLILTSQEFNFKIAKLNFEYYSAYNKQSLLDVCVVDEGLDLPVTALCMDCVSLATGYQNGLICLWSLSLAKCELRLKNTVENRRKKSVVQIELTQAYVISLSEDHQMFIWSRLSGDLVKEFKFLSPVENRLDLTGIDSGELNTHADGSSVFNGLMSLAKSFSKRVFSQVYSDLGDGADDELVFKPMPRMCLYSRSILITAGCSSILIWNIVKGELVKKIKIKKPLVVNFGEEKTSKCRDNYYSQKNFIKEIRLVEKNAFCDENYSVLFATNVLKNAKKFVLIIDYTDSFYVLKIPSNCFDD